MNRVVDLWAAGEKVLVFCFFRQTCRALYEHIRLAIEQRMLRIAQEKLGGEYSAADSSEMQAYLDRVARRFSEQGRPFFNEIRTILALPFQEPRYSALQPFQGRLVEVLTAYFRSPSFVARYLPLDDPAVQGAWEHGESRREFLEPGLAALRRGIEQECDGSGLSCLDRVRHFLDYVLELAERVQHGQREESNQDGQATDPLDECLSAVAVHSRRRRPDVDGDEDDEDAADPADDGSYRVERIARMVHGETKPKTRERLVLAFNSPLFPEVLVSSSVMGEGVDLHRFCRHVIHHDGCWNPSTLEQQTGRLDRIRCKAEICGMPIRVYQPFIAGSVDEKQFRVLRDRERWFQIVMGREV